MNGNRPHLLVLTSRRTSWLERVLFTLGGVAVLLIGFFFLTVALVAGALFALVILARLWWISRKLQRSHPQNVFEGEYETVERAESRHSERK